MSVRSGDTGAGAGTGTASGTGESDDAASSAGAGSADADAAATEAIEAANNLDDLIVPDTPFDCGADK